MAGEYAGEAGRSFGDDLSGNLNRTGSCDYDADFGLSHMDSFSSSDKENAKPGRKSVLDDALFQFFRKEAIKSLKRDFSKFCEESVLFSKNKRLKEHSIGRESFTSYSIKYFCDISKSLTFRRKEVIRNFGFGHLLLLEKCEIPSPFVRWICSRVDHVSHQIIVNDSKIISISKDSVHFVTGLPNSGSVPMPDSDGGAKFILKLFGLSEMPHITFFGNKLKSQDVLTDTEVFVSFDVCALVFEHLISGVYKYNKSCKLKGRKPKVFEFCYYILAVYYLDSLDFGARIIDQSVPRISVWNGNLVKFFSDLDRTKNNIFGKRHLRKNLSSCYTEGEVQDVSKCVKDAPHMCSEISCFSLAFKNSLHLRFGSTLEGKIIDGIIDSFQSAITSKHPPVCKSEGAASLDSNKQIKSPEVVMTKTAEASTVSTAPTMLPPKKVMSRFPHLVHNDQFLLSSKNYPTGVKDSSAFVIHGSNNDNSNVQQSISFGGFVVDNNITSPISKINFSQAFVEQDVSAFLMPQGGTINKNSNRSSTISGSKGAPILVHENSPKDILKSSKVSNGSNDFRARQVQLASESDELYNKFIKKDDRAAYN
ncbi:uncharacterized protein LOC124663017 [Lolium rigidum]|uniref:uncharacterized protein LOC124663017 n=1 Tax=Lolium rigidum TaxID=89674 RepID=UPI001F5CA63E|nr:uncharacterized protein LOC124663017 [Lolium rigidum]